MTYPRRAEAKNRGGGGDAVLEVNICARPPCAADPSATCRATAGESVALSAVSGAWTGLSSAM